MSHCSRSNTFPITDARVKRIIRVMCRKMNSSATTAASLVVTWQWWRPRPECVCCQLFIFTRGFQGCGQGKDGKRPRFAGSTSHTSLASIREVKAMFPVARRGIDVLAPDHCLGIFVSLTV